jgi:nitrogen regulatory protein P-II 1
MYMIMFVLNKPDLLNSVLNAWQEAGISGVTIIESTGLHRLKLDKQSVGKLFATFRHYAHDPEEEGHLTLLTIVPDETYIEKCVQASESVVGDLDEPHNGIIAAWNIAYSKGVGKDYQ